MAVVHSSTRICDLSRIIENMAPIKIYINRDLVWDDDWYDGTLDMVKLFNDTIYREDIVVTITFEIVHFHHSICYISTI